MSQRAKTILLWLLLLGLFFGCWQLLKSKRELPSEAATGFLADLDAGLVATVAPDHGHLVVTTTDGAQYATPARIEGALATSLQAHHVAIVEPREDDSSSFGWSTALTLAPIVVIVALFVVYMRRMGGGNLLSFRKTTARLVAVPSTTFAEIGGAAEAKDRLREVVDFMRNPKRWERAGVRLPTGVLLEGPPGCGKTLLARAVAGEAKIPFFEISASEFVELFVGVGAARVRDLFEQAAKKAPAIVFIDELDAIGRRRGAGLSSIGHQEREQTLNQLLVNLDGFQKTKRVVVIAATNRADILDLALLRPGRFDLRIRLPAPPVEGRAEILAIHTRNKSLDPGVDLREIAEATEGLSGADLELLCNEAAMSALRRAPGGNGKPVVLARADFDVALAKRAAPAGPFNKLDAAIVESASQLTQPTSRVVLRAHLDGAVTVEGELLWVDATFLKIRTAEGASILLAKSKVVRIEAMDAAPVDRSEIGPDPWLRANPDVA